MRSVKLPSLAELDRRAKIRLVLGGGAVLSVVCVFAACGACGKRSPGGGDTTVAALADGAVSPKEGTLDAAMQRDPLLWSHAKTGEEEDLTALAAHEGAAGLIEAASDPSLRPTAIRSMGFARGWAQLPFLARAAGGTDDDEAQLALTATLELAIRPRTAEDPEDADELREGCDLLTALARDTARPRPRRVSSVRALRMMPCPPPSEPLPSDVDTK